MLFLRCVRACLAIVGGVLCVLNARMSAAQGPIIADHTCTKIQAIPTFWIDQAKTQFRVTYGHTSHGSQPISGMGVLRDDASYSGLYDFNTNGAIEAGTLSLADRTPSGDLWSYLASMCAHGRWNAAHPGSTSLCRCMSDQENSQVPLNTTLIYLMR